jgi:hypothetical protein
MKNKINKKESKFLEKLILKYSLKNNSRYSLVGKPFESED